MKELLDNICDAIHQKIEIERCNYVDFIWRLSAIVLVPLLVLIYVIYMPIKWLIVGEFGFTKGTDKKKYEHIIWLWIKKTGL